MFSLAAQNFDSSERPLHSVSFHFSVFQLSTLVFSAHNLHNCVVHFLTAAPTVTMTCLPSSASASSCSSSSTSHLASPPVCVYYFYISLCFVIFICIIRLACLTKSPPICPFPLCLLLYTLLCPCVLCFLATFCHLASAAVSC